MKSKETRKIVTEALSKFWATDDPNNRLNCLWKISQLAEDTTDDELYELASAVAVEDDFRLRGEICYAISRSRRPTLAHFLKNMVHDEDNYVRDEAIKAISELNGINEATITAVEQLLNTVYDLKSAVVTLGKDMQLIRNDTMKLINSAIKPHTEDAVTTDNRMECWETYLRHEMELLREHRGEYAAIYKGEIVSIAESDEILAKMIQDKYGAVEALICKIEEENEEPVQVPFYDTEIMEL